MSLPSRGPAALAALAALALAGCAPAAPADGPTLAPTLAAVTSAIAPTPAPTLVPTVAQLPSAERKALQDELLAMMEADQAARARITRPNPPRELIAELQAIDARNTARMKEIVDRYGWPGLKLVGPRAAEAAWLLVQHADADPPFQRRCLELMQAAPPSDIPKRDLAYLTDRVLVNEGKPQIYGTQPDFVDGRYVAPAVAEPERLDELRRDAGLPPLSRFIADLNFGLSRPTPTP